MRLDDAANECRRFSTLQRVEIAEMAQSPADIGAALHVSVLFNESKLLKFDGDVGASDDC